MSSMRVSRSRGSIPRKGTRRNVHVGTGQGSGEAPQLLGRKRGRDISTEHNLVNPPIRYKEARSIPLQHIQRNVDDGLTSSALHVPPSRHNHSVHYSQSIDALSTLSPDFHAQIYQGDPSAHDGMGGQTSTASQYISDLIQLRQMTDAAEEQRRIQVQKEEELRQQKLKQEEDARRQKEEAERLASKEREQEEIAKQKAQEASTAAKTVDAAAPSATNVAGTVPSASTPATSGQTASHFPLETLKRGIPEEWIPVPMLSPVGVPPEIYNAYVRNVVRVFEETQERALNLLSKVGTHPAAKERYPKQTWFDPMSFALSDSFAQDVCEWNTVEAGTLLGKNIPGGSKICVQRLDLLTGVRESVIRFAHDMMECLREAWKLDAPYLSQLEHPFAGIDNKRYTRTMCKIGPHFALACDRISSLILARSMRDTVGLGNAEKVSYTQRARIAAAQLAISLFAAVGCSAGPAFPIGALFRERFMAFMWQASPPSSGFFPFKDSSNNVQQVILEGLAGTSKGRRENMVFRTNQDNSFRLEWRDTQADPQKNLYESLEHASALMGAIQSLQIIGPMRVDVNIYGNTTAWTQLALCIRAIRQQAPFNTPSRIVNEYYMSQLSTYLAHFTTQVSSTLASYYGLDTMARTLDVVYATSKKSREIMKILTSTQENLTPYTQCLRLSSTFPDTRLTLLESLLTSYSKSVEEFAGVGLFKNKDSMEHTKLPNGSKPYHFLTVNWPIILCNTHEEDDRRITQEEPEEAEEEFFY